MNRIGMLVLVVLLELLERGDGAEYVSNLLRLGDAGPEIVDMIWRGPNRVQALARKFSIFGAYGNFKREVGRHRVLPTLWAQIVDHGHCALQIISREGTQKKLPLESQQDRNKIIGAPDLSSFDALFGPQFLNTGKSES
jgi:hypothetical protein